MRTVVLVSVLFLVLALPVAAQYQANIPLLYKPIGESDPSSTPEPPMMNMVWSGGVYARHGSELVPVSGVTLEFRTIGVPSGSCFCPFNPLARAETDEEGRYSVTIHGSIWATVCNNLYVYVHPPAPYNLQTHKLLTADLEPYGRWTITLDGEYDPLP